MFLTFINTSISLFEGISSWNSLLLLWKYLLDKNFDFPQALLKEGMWLCSYFYLSTLYKFICLVSKTYFLLAVLAVGVFVVRY